MKKLIAKYRLTLIGAGLGALAGFAYWYFVGCSTGSCAITSSPINSTLYFALAGGLIVNTFSSEPQKTKENGLEK
jgi:hypothetical protein